jgi:hypothetical protein
MIDESDLADIALAVSEQNRIDRDSAGPKEPYENTLYKDVTIASRYSVKHEFNSMRRIIDAMPQLIAVRVETIWCDSLAGACYTVMLQPGAFTEVILESIFAAFVKAVGGWNGLIIYGDKGQSQDFDCYWLADDAGSVE